MAAFSFKIADSDDEFEAIHALNYRTFVEEIPQHPPNSQHRLVDTFHDENTYAICKVGDSLVGMIAGRAQRPFSLDRKLENLDSYLPPHRYPVEVRLLAVEPEYRKSTVLGQLIQELAKHFMTKGHDLVLISGTLRQSRLYRHMGFTEFGPQVGTEEALYQPMYLDLHAYSNLEQKLGRMQQRNEPVVNFLPGPVAVKSEVEKAMAMPPVSHRSAEFQTVHNTVTEQLRKLTQSQHVFLMSGSGTTANDAIAAQLSVSGGRGLVLSNGEFGERLIDHARRWNLEYIEYRIDWGESFAVGAVTDVVAANADIRWIWMVACETSTGINNPWEEVALFCRKHEIDFCLDAVSAVGTRPLDLADVRYASCVSGKALGAYPGIACVLYNGPALATINRLPRTLDLALYQGARCVPFTMSSNLLYALSAALTHTDWQEKYVRINHASAKLRRLLRERGIAILAQGDDAAPAVITIVVPDNIDSVALCQKLRGSRYLLSGESGYLGERNWLQVCLFGEFNEDMLYPLVELMSAQMEVETATL